MKITISPTNYPIKDVKHIKKCVRLIVKDYVKNFKIRRKIKDVSLDIVFQIHKELTDGGKYANAAAGIITYQSHKKEVFAIHVADDKGGEDTAFWNTLAHEIVHYCQYITGRWIDDESKIPYRYQVNEIEAFGLSTYYVSKYLNKP